jgi:hypothetical protein
VIRSRIFALVIVGALAGACGSNGPTPAPSTPEQALPSASTAPTASASPSPSPEPTPVDASAAFVAAISDPAFTANVALTGTSKLGSVTTTTAGTMDVHGRAAHVVTTTTTGKTKVRTESLVGNGARFIARYGLWFAAGDAPTNDLAATLRGITTGVTDTGVETKDARDLHHLTIQSPATLAAAISLAAKGISNVEAAIEAWAEEDGTPVLASIHATWDQAVSGRTAHGTKDLQLAFSNVGSSVDVIVPTDLWKLATSKRYHYGLAYPTDWEPELNKKGYTDAYFGFDGQTVYVDRFSVGSASLNQVSSELKNHPNTFTGYRSVKILSNKSGRLGPQRARVVELSGTYEGKKHWWLVYFAVKGGNTYWMELRTDVKTTGADRALAAKFAKSFTFR